MRLSRQFQASFFCFFFTRRFWAYKKHQNPKQMIPTLLEVFVCAKSCCLCLLIFVYVDWFWLICAFALSKYFHKKKIINWLEIVLIASFTILLLFLSLHVFTALEFDCNHLGILLWKRVKPCDHTEIKPPIGKVFGIYKPVKDVPKIIFVLICKQVLWQL